MCRYFSDDARITILTYVVGGRGKTHLKRGGKIVREYQGYGGRLEKRST